MLKISHTWNAKALRETKKIKGVQTLLWNHCGESQWLQTNFLLEEEDREDVLQVNVICMLVSLWKYQGNGLEILSAQSMRHFEVMFKFLLRN